MTIIVLNKDQMGNGDSVLGRKLLGACLRKSVNLPGLDAIVFYNEGVRLVAKDSYLAAEIQMIEHRGVELIACGTCIEHYGLQDNLIIDHASGMDDIIAIMNKADKVITL